MRINSDKKLMQHVNVSNNVVLHLQLRSNNQWQCTTAGSSFSVNNAVNASVSADCFDVNVWSML